MKTAELTGGILDYWVAKSEGLQCHMRGNKCWVVNQVFEPSTDWMEGGPIMDRERTGFMHHAHRVSHETKYSVDAFLPGRRHESGPTMLIAAMRAYVASKYGDEVPDIESN